MKYNDEDFENYLIGKMSESEKNEFENSLIASSELQNNFDNYKKLKELITNTRSIKLSEEYSSGILPRFRNELQENKKNKIYYNLGAITAAFASVIIGFVLTVNLFIKTDPDKPSDLITIIENDRDSIINSFDISDKLISKADSESFQIIDSVYNDLLSQNINVESETDDFDAFAFDIENADLEQFISEEEIDQIYAQLMEKKF
ncbi:MAG: hypothetical protein HND40_07745 [Ignavibacteriota bacterium]|nr:hypothetical protein [Ignavibacteriota bacterium]MCO6447528.1 hypothetical protein [Ignavibacterium album]MCZ2267311.1 hypothetical protein [Ignavibacteriales bacterium]HMN16425.1 hypothetical protein [Ignavibacteriaceae bacterium]QKJ99451.1 MAG: hypothetical protein HND40_07745 [Ignavibacteriota bacterium]